MKEEFDIHTHTHTSTFLTPLTKQIFYSFIQELNDGIGVWCARGSKGLRRCLGRTRLGREMEMGNVERLLSIIIKIYTPVCTTYVSP